jgi:predicted ATPase
MGRGEQATEECERALAHAERVAHPLSMALALIFGALLARERGQLEVAREHAQAAEALSEANGFPFWQSAASILVGTLRVQGGEQEGADLIQEGLTRWQGTGSQLGRSYYTGLLSSALLQGGHLDQGLSIVDDALASAEACGERLNLAELHRLRAIALDGLGRKREADQALQEAIAVAQAQGAASYALRSALTFLRIRPGEPRAKQALREAYAVLPSPADGPEAEEARRALGLAG